MPIYNYRVLQDVMGSYIKVTIEIKGTIYYYMQPIEIEYTFNCIQQTRKRAKL